MNENESEEVPPPIPFDTQPLPPLPEPWKPKPFSYWLKHFLVCNPFYLASAALLLFGVYLVSMDPGSLTRNPDQFEIVQLKFNLGSLQFYEVLLVGTAIFLARRRIWYDSLLLVALENLLLFVPFILISQAGLIDKRLVWVLCLAAGLILLGRFGSLKKFYPELNLPNRLAALGSVIVVVNVVLPAVYRVLGESQMGKKATFGPAYTMNEYAWLLILPAVFALAFLLQPGRETGKLLPQRSWLSGGLFSLWIAGTAVHLYCLRYVYDFDMRRELVAPSLWVLAWILCARLSHWFEFRMPHLSRALLFPPLLIAVSSTQNGNKVYLALTALNVLIYGIGWLLRRDNRVLPHLAFVSLAMLIVPNFERVHWIAVGTAIYLLLCSMLSRNPRVALFASIMLTCSVMVLSGRQTAAVHWALQCGMAFLLLHSLRWEDEKHPGAGFLRAVTALVWVICSFAWMRFNGQWWMPGIFGFVVLGGWLVACYFRGRWEGFLLPVAAAMVLASGPGDVSIEQARSLPGGLLAVIGSLVLFAVGTVLALTKDRWHPSR